MSWADYGLPPAGDDWTLIRFMRPNLLYKALREALYERTGTAVAYNRMTLYGTYNNPLSAFMAIGDGIKSQLNATSSDTHYWLMWSGDNPPDEESLPPRTTFASVLAAIGEPEYSFSDQSVPFWKAYRQAYKLLNFMRWKFMTVPYPNSLSVARSDSAKWTAATGRSAVTNMDLRYESWTTILASITQGAGAVSSYRNIAWYDGDGARGYARRHIETMTVTLFTQLAPFKAHSGLSFYAAQSYGNEQYSNPDFPGLAEHAYKNFWSEADYTSHSSLTIDFTAQFPSILTTNQPEPVSNSWAANSTQYTVSGVGQGTVYLLLDLQHDFREPPPE